MPDPLNALKSRLKSCALFALGPAVLLFALVIIFLVNNRPPSIHVPTPRMPKDNGYDYFVRAGKMLGVQGPSSCATRQPNSWTVPELKRYVLSNAPALAMVREGLKRECVLPPARSAKGVFLPEFARTRELARRVVDEGRYYRAIGNFRRAADSHLDCIEMGAVFPRGGSLIAGLVGEAIEAIGEHDFGQLIPNLDSGGLAHVAARLERIETRQVPYAEVIEEEGRVSAAILVEECGRPGYLWSFANPASWFSSGPFGFSGRPSAGEVYLRARYAFCNKTAACRSFMDYAKATAAEARKPYTGKFKVSVPANPVLQMLSPVFDRVRQCWELEAAKRALIQADVALRRYRFDHGRYPDALSALVPAYLKKQPIDPFGIGKPLRYKSLNGGKDFLLYSLGPNLKDDGGTPGSQQNSYSTGDVVAGKW